MSYTTGTTHYNLPLTSSNDKRDWADTNQAFTDVDAALYGAVSNTSTQGAEITELDTRLTTAEGNISTNAASITALDTRLTTAEGNITTQATQLADVRSDAEDMICAYNEATATSTHAYAIGDYFIYNDVLYRATAAITVGDTIVPDTNCTTTNVTTEIATAGDNAVDMICTVTENTTTATRNYYTGDYFILNDVLYRVTATITVGTTIVPETNCISTNAMSEIKDLTSEKVLLDQDFSGTSWRTVIRQVEEVIKDNSAYDARIEVTTTAITQTGYTATVIFRVANKWVGSSDTQLSFFGWAFRDVDDGGFFSCGHNDCYFVEANYGGLLVSAGVHNISNDTNLSHVKIVI